MGRTRDPNPRLGPSLNLAAVPYDMAMPLFSVSSWFGLALLSVSLGASTQGNAVPPKVVAPKPQDVASMDSLIKATYDVISGPAGQKRDWDRMRSLFAEKAALSAAVKTRSGKIRYIPMDVEGYIKRSGPYLEQNGFFEHEIARHVDSFGNIAQVFSTYESRNKADDKKPFERGINSFQLLNDGERWWIVSIYWQGEDSTTPLPRKWLKH